VLNLTVFPALANQNSRAHEIEVAAAAYAPGLALLSL
jgi:hypothetical protein